MNRLRSGFGIESRVKHWLQEGAGQNTDPHSMNYPNDYPKMDYATEVKWLGLGNWVNEVLGQFSQCKDPKWNLIHSVC